MSKALDRPRGLQPVIEKEIGDAVNAAVQTCTTVPASLDVAAYSRQLVDDIADMAPSGISRPSCGRSSPSGRNAAASWRRHSRQR